MKRFLALVLSLVMLLSFTACGNNGAEDSSSNQGGATVTKEGKCTDGVYVNKWAGIKIALEGIWAAYDGTDLPDLNGDNTKFGDDVEQWYDFVATNEASESFMVVFEKTDKTPVEYLEIKKDEAVKTAEKNALIIDTCQITTTTVAGMEATCLEVFYSEEDGIETLITVIEGDGALIVITAYCTESGPYALLKSITKA